MKEISVIIPVYNEAQSLPILADKLKRVLDGLGKSSECIFIDDGSTDNSYDVLRDLKGRMDFIKIIKLRKNFGQTAAIAAGFDYAEGNIVIPMDADLQNDPEDIPLVISKLEEGYDIVSGWRSKRDDPLFTKKIPSWTANRIISTLTGVKLHDFGCTLKAYKKEVVRDIRLYGEMHRFIPAIASFSGASIAEIPVRHHGRKYGRSKYGITRTLKVLLDLITVKFFLSYSTSPMQIFGFIGFVTMFAGGCSLIATIVMKWLRGIDMTGNPLLYLTVLFMVIGVQFILMGTLGEIMIRVYHEGQSKQIYHIEKLE